MSGTSNQSKPYTIRLKNETIAKIQEAIKNGNGEASSVNEYCKIVVERWVWRHTKK